MRKKLISLLLIMCFVYSTIANKQDFIGMPVGGINCGQVYIAGDGHLWYWDIFNYQRINPGGPGDKFYLNPLYPTKDFEQGFAIRINEYNDNAITTKTRTLDKNGFSEINFSGEYPLAKVNYNDNRFPVSAKLTAYSPFIPTNNESSDFPAVVMEFEVTNKLYKDIDCEVISWLQNMTNFKSSSKAKGEHINELIKTENSLQIKLFSNVKDTDLPDYGNMCLSVVNPTNAWGTTVAPSDIEYNLHEVKGNNKKITKIQLGNKLVASIGDKIHLKARETKSVKFILSWYYPNLHRKESGFHDINNRKNLRYYYSKKFTSSVDVANKIINNQEKYLTTTKEWNKTWYNSTLDKSFLDRTFLNTSTLATTAFYRLDDLTNNQFNEGRLYAMEGVYLGHGTCTHVFHYEQALGRVFPNLARQLREQIDLGLSFNDGIISYRGELRYGHHDGRAHAIDGHAGTILRIYREHLTAPNNDFLKRNWKKIKQATQYMIDQDKEKTGKADGILEGIQYNTLDRIWYGKISWISGLYNAALRASAQMAKAIEDKDFANTCSKISALGKKNMSNELFNGEYFIQILDQDNLEFPNTNKGCHADQLLGEYWANQLGLGNVFDKIKVEKALNSLYKYNFVKNYGKYLENAKVKIKRVYADNDESGLIMCTFPRGGEEIAPGKVNNEWEKLVIGYFSEMWTGQEHQVAATMMDHGMVDQSLDLINAVNDRYAAEKRNPYNEIEYGNHYTRAMSGFAPFISATGFYLNEPEGVIGFDPKINKDNFKSAYISGASWGTYSQNSESINLELNYGELNINKFIIPNNYNIQKASKLLINGKELKFSKAKANNKDCLSFKNIKLNKGDTIYIKF